MGQAIDGWLTQFGLKSPAPDHRSLDATAPRRRAKAAPGEPDIVKRSSETKRQAEMNVRPRRRGGPTMIPGEPIGTRRSADPVNEFPPRRPQRRQAPPIIPVEPSIVRPSSAGTRPGDARPLNARRVDTRPLEVSPVEARRPHPLRPQGPPSRALSDPIALQRPVEPVIPVPPRHDGSTITRGDQIAMDLTKPAPAIPVQAILRNRACCLRRQERRCLFRSSRKRRRVR